ncbi:MAG: DUF2188 domain-containing protein [Ignavibacteria bacterium]
MSKKNKNQHVVPTRSGWAVKGEGNTKNTKLTDTKAEAIEYAKRIAKNQKSELVIHNKDGKISDKDSFGNDTFPKRDMIH